MGDKKLKQLDKIVKYVLPVSIVLILLGLFWVGKNSFIIGATISTVDKALKEAYLERDAFRAQMKTEAGRKDSIRQEFKEYRAKKIKSAAGYEGKINMLQKKLSHEKMQNKKLEEAYTALRDSINSIKLRRSPIEDRYKNK